MSEKQSKNTFRAPKTHRLKTWPTHFADIRSRKKTFELRRDDRDFQPGDELVLVQWDPNMESETGQTEIRTISHVFKGGRFGLATGFCILSFENVAKLTCTIDDAPSYEVGKHKKQS
jgi:hypothetical protein